MSKNLAIALEKIPKYIGDFSRRVRLTAVRGMLAYTPPITRTMAPGLAPDRSQRPVRELRAHILAQLIGDPKAPSLASEDPTPSNQFNWAYTNVHGDPVRARGPVHLPLVVPRPRQKNRPNKSVDALAWILSNTVLVSKRGCNVRRALRPGVNPSELVWTSRSSWRAAAKTLSLRGGNFLSGWSAADEWARGGSGASWLSRVLPANGNYGRQGAVYQPLGSADLSDATLTNSEVPDDPAMRGFAQRVIDGNVEKELARAIKLHEPFLLSALHKLAY